MTDKDIIIDRVNVAGCKYLKDCVIPFDCEIDRSLCWNNPNCYYKRLARKTQECEELKRDNSTLFDKAMETRKENIELQVQLDQLKAAKEQAEGKLERIKEVCIKYKTCRIILKDTILQIIDEV